MWEKGSCPVLKLYQVFGWVWQTEAAGSSETMVTIHQNKRHHIPEDRTLNFTKLLELEGCIEINQISF
jgi:hypothetical protein